MITIYAASYCSWCKKAAELLMTEGITFLCVDITNDAAAWQSLANLSGCNTVPQIWIDGRFIGGYGELEAHREQG